MYTHRSETLICGRTQRYKKLNKAIVDNLVVVTRQLQCYTTALELRMIHTDPSSATELVNFLNNHAQLTKFCVSHNHVMTKKCSVIQKVVTDATYVTALELIHCTVPMRIGCALASRLMLPKCAITTLVLRHAKLGTHTLSALARYISTTTTLTYFAYIHDTRKFLLRKAIEDNNSIERLKVIQVDISNARMPKFLTVLAQKPHLIRLAMSSNVDKTNETRTSYSFDFPEFNPALKKFRWWNLISRGCVESLAARFRANKTLTHVNLANSELGTTNTNTILAAFHNNPTIKKIDVSWNNAVPTNYVVAPLLETAPALKRLDAYIPREHFDFRTEILDRTLLALRNHRNITLLGRDPCNLHECAKWLQRNLTNKKNKKWTLFRVMATRVKEYNLL